MRLPPVLNAICLAAALLLACSICTPAFAQTAVDLQLVLAVDASGSVDQRRFELQMQGYVSKDTTTVQVPPPFPNLQYFRPVVYKKSTVSTAPFTVTPPPAATDNNVYMDEFAWALDQKFLSQNIDQLAQKRSIAFVRT